MSNDDADIVGVRKRKRETAPRRRAFALDATEQCDLRTVQDEGTELLALRGNVFFLPCYFVHPLICLCEKREYCSGKGYQFGHKLLSCRSNHTRQEAEYSHRSRGSTEGNFSM